MHELNRIRQHLRIAAATAHLSLTLLLAGPMAPAHAVSLAECEKVLGDVNAQIRIKRFPGGFVELRDDSGEVLWFYDQYGSFEDYLKITKEEADCLVLVRNSQAAQNFASLAGEAPPPASIRMAATAAVQPAVVGAHAFDIADLDGDGDLDTVTLEGSDSLTVWRQDANGQLLPAADIQIGTGGSQVVLADLNEDSHADAIVARAGNYGADPGDVTVLLGRGDATFQAARSFAAGKVPLSLAVADLNGDDHLDVVTANADQAATPRNVAILLGDGAGGLGTPRQLTGIPETTAILAADFNGDDVADLAVAHWELGIALLRGNGDGSFKAALDSDVGVPLAFLTALDLNGDGTRDLVGAAANNGAIAYLPGIGDGSFSVPLFAAAGTGARSFAVSDRADDGSVRVLVPDAAHGGLAVHSITGDGRLLAPATYLTHASGPNDIAVADFNRDGKPDVATAGSSAPGISLFKGVGGVRLESQAPLNLAGLSTLATGDFDKDGTADIVAVGNVVSFLRGRGDFTFEPSVDTPLAASEHRDVDAADFDGDGLLDLAVASSGPSAGSGQVSVVLGAGGGAFSVATLAAGTHPVAVVAQDVNRDGNPDLVVVDTGTFQSDTDPGGIYVFAGRGNGAFRAPRRYDAGRNPSSVAVGDLNADAWPDFAVTTGGPGFESFYGVLMGNGTGRFGRARLTQTADSPAQVAIGAFSADPAADLMIAYCCGATDMAIVPGLGDGTFLEEEHFPAGANVQRMAFADFNQDGLKDLAVANSVFTFGSGSVSILLRYAGLPSCQARLPTHVGTGAPDTLTGSAGDDVIVGLGGGDRIDGAQGNDLACGGAGNDTLLGGNGDDSLWGDAGQDLLTGGPGNDSLNGGSGNDSLSGTSGDDALSGGPGTDDCRGGADTDTARDCEAVSSIP